MSSGTIPEALLRETVTDLQQVAMAHGNIHALDTFKTPPSVYTLFFITCILTLIAYIIAELSNYFEIKRNWAQYRCMPTIAPFSKFYGHDLSETMNFCMSQAVREHADDIINPIYMEINKITGTVDGVYNQVEGIAGGVTGLIKGLDKFIVGFMNSFRLVGVRVRMTFVRMKNIIDRIYGIFMSFSYAAISAITFGENLACNPMVTFMGEMTGTDVCCFAPDTRIAMADNQGSRMIRDIQIGDVLAGGAVVTSTYLFNGNDIPMVRLYDVHVSTNHFVWSSANQSMVQAGDHPDAIFATSIPRLWCIGTSTHRIPVLLQTSATLIQFADYEESTDPSIIAKVQCIAETALNGFAGKTIPEYNLGLDPTLDIKMKDGSWAKLSDIRIGDELANNGQVIGIINEFCTRVCNRMSDAQLVKINGIWLRAGNVWKIEDVNVSFCFTQLMVTTNEFIIRHSDGTQFSVRDYAEISGYEIQEPYSIAMNSYEIA